MHPAPVDRQAPPKAITLSLTELLLSSGVDFSASEFSILMKEEMK
jgi:hypothetical protein